VEVRLLSEIPDFDEFLCEVELSGGNVFICPAEELEVYFRDENGEVRSSLDSEFPARVGAVRFLQDLVVVDYSVVNMVKLMLDSPPEIRETILVGDVTVYVNNPIPATWKVLGIRIKDVLFQVQTFALEKNLTFLAD